MLLWGRISKINMAETTLIQKLEGLQHKFDEISTLITDPSVISDQKRYVKLNKEYRELEDLLNAKNSYELALSHHAEAKQLLANESDPEMREMAKAELDELEERIPQLEEEIKLLLIPADPEDNKNAIVEIRGGTGGDEAAIFAGDLFKMYTRYCESNGWKVEVTNVSEGTSGGYKEVIFTVSGDNVYNGYLKPKRRAGYIPRQLPWLYCPKPKSLISNSKNRMCGWILSVLRELADSRLILPTRLSGWFISPPA